MRFSRRSFRELPGATTRIRGANDLPYNPRRPLRLPGDRRRRRRPQLNGGARLRLLLPMLALAGLGVGVFFGVDALVDDEAAPAAAPTPSAPVAAAPQAPASAAAAVKDSVPAAAPIDVERSAPADVAPTASEAEAAPDPVPAQPDRPTIITSADLGGAPVVVERGAARPIPAGLPNRTVAPGLGYDPADATFALSSVWAAGTTLELTRLPGGPQLSEEDTAALIGTATRVVVGGAGAFRTELELSPAAFQLLAREHEEIIALRIEVVEAPPLP